MEEIKSKDFESNIQFFLNRNIGQGFFVSRSIRDEDISYHTIGRYYPIVIRDHKQHKKYVRFYKIDDLFTLERELEIVRVPNKKYRSKAFEKAMKRLAFGTERVLLNVAFRKLAHVSLIRDMLNPFTLILRGIHEEKSISMSDLFPNKPRAKVQRYIELLESLELVTIKKNYLSAGNMYNSLFKESKEKGEDFDGLLLGAVLQGGAGYIEQYLRITSINPFLKWATTYYNSAIKAGDNIAMSLDEYIDQYQDIYYKSTINRHSARNRIEDLVKVKVIDREGKYYTANPDTVRKLRLQLNG